MQRISDDGRQVGPLKVERLVARGHVMQNPALSSGFLPRTEMSGWCHVRFENAADAVKELQLALSFEGAVMITAVAAGGAAQRAGVHPGFRIGTLNGDPDNLRERLAVALSGGTVGPIVLDLFSPTPHCHGVPSLGDTVARTPLSAPGIVDSLL